MEHVTISSSAMLVEVSISTWTARKLDKAVTDEVNTSKSASVNASRVNKNLLPGVEQLDAITKYAAATRSWVAANTLPWNDFGARLVPTEFYFEFNRELTRRKDEFEQMVQDFLVAYPTLISAQAFKLGSMFNRAEYPSVDTLSSRFGMRITYTPVPTAGDFRVDIHNTGLQELRRQYEESAEERVRSAMDELKKRLFNAVHHLIDRMTDDGDKRKRFHSDILDRFAETMASIRMLNVTKDDVLDEFVAHAEHVVSGLSVDDLRDDPDTRKDVKDLMQGVLSKFDI